MKIWQIVGIKNLILCFFLPFCTNVKRVLQTTEGLKKKVLGPQLLKRATGFVVVAGINFIKCSTNFLHLEELFI